MLLAPKERFEEGGAGAFALNVLETSSVSRWRDGITVFGSPVLAPFPAIRFQPLELPKWSFRGRNIAMAHCYVEVVKASPPDLVEVFNRPVMIRELKRGLPEVPVALHFGNDPRGMEGSRSVAERRALLALGVAIVCVSDFIRRCFLEGIDGPLGTRTHVIHTGVPASAVFPVAKEPKIIFAGRIVPEKGVLELVEALARVLPLHPTWSAEIYGARWFGDDGLLSNYEKAVSRAAGDCRRIVFAGFQPHARITDALRAASIAVVPSGWDDPFPRAALEALAQGCALVCSRRGGLPELGDGRALYLDTVSAQSLEQALQRLISNDAERLALQRRGWEDFPFEICRSTRQLDDLRDSIFV